MNHPTARIATRVVHGATAEERRLHRVRHRAWSVVLRSKRLAVLAHGACERVRRKLAAQATRDALRMVRRGRPKVVSLR